MKIIISPAKSLDFETKATTEDYSTPRFLDQSEKLNRKLKTLSRKKLSELMKISDDLSALNYDRNQSWNMPFDLNNAKQAVFSFTGEVYRGIDVMTLEEDKIPALQDKLRILSGLYGLLKPLDLIQPYRLEMGTKLKIGRTENLYKFWDTTLADSLNDELEDGELLVNLASTEYFKALPKKVLKVPMITPVFKDFKNGQYKTIMTFAKKARGLMVRYIIDNDVETVDQLKAFDVDGYGFSEELSKENELVFTR
ncbi:peroxide stress protein YaaA [uncultured Tenacibaculum sp.]|uniref:peroxide stress protein YaaA n=1 Tax=uncultured Tenacibaculum sp. TaxID=174713 RepID=UPI00260C3634|nr:peroxide stress protein YaaA [uncultured Tenacibaculum sp.]